MAIDPNTVIKEVVDASTLVFYGIIALFIIAIIIVVVIIILERGKYKHTFIRKILTGGPPVVVIDYAKEYKDKKTGNIFWKLRDAKHVIGRPPNTVLHSTVKGTYCVEAYYLGDINYHYLANVEEEVKKDLFGAYCDYKMDFDKSLLSKFKQFLADIKLKNILNLTVFNPEPIYVYNKSLEQTINDKYLITTNQRLIAYEEIRKAAEQRGGTWAQWLPVVAGLGALVILVAVVFIFGNDLIKPMVELNQQNVEVTKQNAQIANQLADVARLLTGTIQDKQYITGSAGGTVALLNKTAPG
jgi:hypothetical protein